MLGGAELKLMKQRELVDFASIVKRLYDISTSKSHFVAAFTKSLTCEGMSFIQKLIKREEKRIRIME